MCVCVCRLVPGALVGGSGQIELNFRRGAQIVAAVSSWPLTAHNNQHTIRTNCVVAVCLCVCRVCVYDVCVALGNNAPWVCCTFGVSWQQRRVVASSYVDVSDDLFVVLFGIVAPRHEL